MNATHKQNNWLKVKVAVSIFMTMGLIATFIVLILLGWPSDLPESFYNKLRVEKLIDLKNQIIKERLAAVTTIATLWGVIAILFNVYYTAKCAEGLDKNANAQSEKVEQARENAVAKEQELAQDRENAQVIEQGQITDRFLAAIGQLGSDKSPVRIGGIYALEKLANNSPTDNSTMVEVITAFVRETAPLNLALDDKKIEDKELPQNTDMEVQQAETATPSRKLPGDIQAALTVLGRRNVKKDEKNYRLDLGNTDIGGASLSAANLAGAFLTGANLQSADLLQANLQGAFLSSANLQGAFLMGAQLQGTVFRGANLQGAFLVGANLLGADLSGANLQGAFLMGANLLGANLAGANLLGADLSEVENLVSGQIESAKVDSTTALPHNVSK